MAARIWQLPSTDGSVRFISRRERLRQWLGKALLAVAWGGAILGLIATFWIF
jgi:hypothetical protein